MKTQSCKDTYLFPSNEQLDLGEALEQESTNEGLRASSGLQQNIFSTTQLDS